MTDPRVDLAALAARLPRPPRTRFGPSPTGHLHLGHVVNALYVWGVVRALRGTVVLRLENHDGTRCRPEYERSSHDDLVWLGLEADEPSRDAWAAPNAWRQQDCDERYRVALDRLRARAHAYACECSRRDVDALVGASSDAERPYPGRCRERGLADARGRGLRLVLPDETVAFDDARLGRLAARPAAQCGDLLIRDRHGFWTYQFAVTVDDMAHEIDLVIRGEDLLASTGRQILLARLLGRATPPVFLHHGLLFRRDGLKLSKSAGDTGVAERRRRGDTPGSVLGEAAFRVGLLGTTREVAVEELPALVGCGPPPPCRSR